MLAPCAIERVIGGELAQRLPCRIIAEGANGPTTPEAYRVLAEHNDGIFVIPDILCNARASSSVISKGCRTFFSNVFGRRTR